MEITPVLSKYRLLWVSAYCMHDTSSGAALQSRLMLECMAQKGIQVIVLGGLIFDSPNGTAQFPNFDEQVKNSTETWLGLEDNGVQYTYLKTADTAIGNMKQSEMVEFFARFDLMLKVFRPDAIAMYGGGPLEYAIRAEAAASGVPAAYAVYNGNHQGYSFPYTNLLITDSFATAKYYAIKSNMNVMPTGIFINPQSCVAENRNPEYVTFINPCPEKGVAAFARLALMAKKQLPNVRFLVVQSRGHWEMALHALRDDANPDFRLNYEEFTNVNVTPHQSDMRLIYAATKVLLAPSVWYEGWGRVATEAIMNGIPVIASASGGLAEAVGEGGCIVPLPEACHLQYTRIPTEEEMQPWLDALAQMLEPANETMWRERALRAAQEHSLEKSTERAMQAFLPLFQRKAGNNPQLFRSGASLFY